jgi:pyruvate-formate lyase-activating enzyme
MPGHNDSVDNIKATAKFVTTELGMDVKVHLLPYYKLGTQCLYNHLAMIMY